MAKLTRIGVGIDFRGHTDQVLQSAARLAGSSGAQLDLIYVHRPPPVYELVLVKVRNLPDVDQAMANARESLELMAARPILSGIRVATHVSLGTPEVEIVARAQELGDDLLVIGPSTRHRPGWLGVGRTASRVVQRSLVPVLIAKSELAEKPARILVTTDFSAASRAALFEAVELARMWGAELVLLHVLEPIFHLQGLSAKVTGETDIYAVEPAELEPEWKSIEAELDLTGVHSRHQVVKGEAVEAILEAVDSLDADLLVVGTHGRSAVTRALLGSSAGALLEESEGPVLVVPSTADLSSGA